jgi:hypothetical protein
VCRSGLSFLSSRVAGWWSATFVDAAGSVVVGSDGSAAARSISIYRVVAAIEATLVWQDLAITLPSGGKATVNVSLVFQLPDGSPVAILRSSSFVRTSSTEDTNPFGLWDWSVSITGVTLPQDSHAVLPVGYGVDVPLPLSPSSDEQLSVASHAHKALHKAMSHDKHYRAHSAAPSSADATPFSWSATYPSSSCAMQLMMVPSKSAGSTLYFASHDSNGWIKSFSMSVSTSGKPLASLGLHIGASNASVAQFWDDGFDGSGLLPGDALVLGVVIGDWWDGASVYRSWALDNAAWTSAGPIAERSDYPAWMVHNHVWVNSGWQPHDIFNRTQGDPAVVLQRVSDIVQRFGFAPALHWYEWDTILFDTHYPEYFPPRPGFQNTTAALQALGVHIVPYINGRIFDIGTQSWVQDEAEHFAAKQKSAEHIDDSDVKIYVETYGSGATFAVMCPATNYWETKISSVTEVLSQTYNVDGVYIDQIAAAGPAACYDPTHTHARGNGDWWMTGYGALLADAQQSAKKQTAFVTESNAEPYMGGIDGYLTLVAFGVDYVPDGSAMSLCPVFPSVYGGYYNGFGAEFPQSDLLVDPDVFTVRCERVKRTRREIVRQ